MALSLHERQVQFYEDVTHSRTLARRIPVIIRCDMECGSSFTKGLKRPWDDIFSNAMQRTLSAMCEKMQGCVLGYTSSDELSFLLLDYQKLDSDAWFGYNIDKLVSTSSALATKYFSEFFAKEVDKIDSQTRCCRMSDMIFYIKTLKEKMCNYPVFDARAFNIPKEEVANYFLDRQRYTEKNSVSMLARHYFSHKEIQGKNGYEMQDMLMKEHGVNWNDVPVVYKRGVFAKKSDFFRIDTESPIVSQNREYIENLVYVGD